MTFQNDNMAANLDELKALRIYFNNPEEEERGFYALLTSGMPVQAIENSRYIINETQCLMLTHKGIKYTKEK